MKLDKKKIAALGLILFVISIVLLIVFKENAVVKTIAGIAISIVAITWLYVLVPYIKNSKMTRKKIRFSKPRFNMFDLLPKFKIPFGGVNKNVINTMLNVDAIHRQKLNRLRQELEQIESKPMKHDNKQLSKNVALIRAYPFDLANCKNANLQLETWDQNEIETKFDKIKDDLILTTQKLKRMDYEHRKGMDNQAANEKALESITDDPYDLIPLLFSNKLSQYNQDEKNMIATIFLIKKHNIYYDVFQCRRRYILRVLNDSINRKYLYMLSGYKDMEYLRNLALLTNFLEDERVENNPAYDSFQIAKEETVAPLALPVQTQTLNLPLGKHRYVDRFGRPTDEFGRPLAVKKVHGSGPNVDDDTLESIKNLFVEPKRINADDIKFVQTLNNDDPDAIEYLKELFPLTEVEKPEVVESIKEFFSTIDDNAIESIVNELEPLEFNETDKALLNSLKDGARAIAMSGMDVSLPKLSKHIQFKLSQSVDHLGKLYEKRKEPLLKDLFEFAKTAEDTNHSVKTNFYTPDREVYFKKKL